MKIEKISDTQIRVTLDHADLENRNIKIGELAYGSTKAQALFKDMMTRAFEDFGFEAENVPLMIEAVPLSTDSIMIVVTKVEDPSQIDLKLDAIGERPTHRTFKEPEEDRLTDLELMGSHSHASSSPLVSNEPVVLMYCFNTLDDVCFTAHHIQPMYFGENSLFKYNQKYFLILHSNQNVSMNDSMLVSVLDEFGQRGISSDLGEMFLLEHGKPIIASNAIDVLAKYL